MICCQRTVAVIGSGALFFMRDLLPTDGSVNFGKRWATGKGNHFPGKSDHGVYLGREICQNGSLGAEVCPDRFRTRNCGTIGRT